MINVFLNKDYTCWRDSKQQTATHNNKQQPAIATTVTSNSQNNKLFFALDVPLTLTAPLAGLYPIAAKTKSLSPMVPRRFARDEWKKLERVYPRSELPLIINIAFKTKQRVPPWSQEILTGMNGRMLEGCAPEVSCHLLALL